MLFKSMAFNTLPSPNFCRQLDRIITVVHANIVDENRESLKQY